MDPGAVPGASTINTGIRARRSPIAKGIRNVRVEARPDELASREGKRR